MSKKFNFLLSMLVESRQGRHNIILLENHLHGNVTDSHSMQKSKKGKKKEQNNNEKTVVKTYEGWLDKFDTLNKLCSLVLRPDYIQFEDLFFSKIVKVT